MENHSKIWASKKCRFMKQSQKKVSKENRFMNQPVRPQLWMNRPYVESLATLQGGRHELEALEFICWTFWQLLQGVVPWRFLAIVSNS